MTCCLKLHFNICTGSMSHRLESSSLAGHEGSGTIAIHFSFKSGVCSHYENTSCYVLFSSLCESAPCSHRASSPHGIFTFQVQGPEHPNPGQPYSASNFPRAAYLPDTPDGCRFCELGHDCVFSTLSKGLCTGSTWPGSRGCSSQWAPRSPQGIPTVSPGTTSTSRPTSLVTATLTPTSWPISCRCCTSPLNVTFHQLPAGACRVWDH